MATKIKRSLYIGLGGTGISALENTKRMFMETYGEVPPMIGFLGIDTDSGESAKEKVKDRRNQVVQLDADEKFPITVRNPKEIYQVNAPSGHMAWLPKDNVYALVSMEKGAGQVRTNGRFALTIHYSALKTKVMSAINKITHARISTNPNYELLSSEVEIHMIFSVCGGTGAGTFINMAYILKEVVPDCKLTGYGVLPDVFEAMSNAGMAKVKPNAYASVCDLDWLMHLDGTKKLTLDYITETPTFDTKPFNAFFFIDNKNTNNDTYTDVSELAELLSLALVTSAGELSTASASVIDNLEKNIMEGDMNIEDKRAWISGLGVCEIVYRGKTLQEIYALKGAKRIIEILLSCSGDAEAIASEWIDKREVNIRENNNKDNVIDFLLQLTPRHALIDIDDKSNAEVEVNMWLDNDAVKVSEINKQMTEQAIQLKKRVDSELETLLRKQANRPRGIGTALEVVSALKSNVSVFLQEMTDELEQLRNHTIASRKNSKEIAVKDLEEYSRRFFKSKSREKELVQEAIEAAKQYACSQRDAMRHEAAISYFNGLLQTLSEWEERLDDVRKKLLNIAKDLQMRIAQNENAVGHGPRMFQIDLAQDVTVSVKDDDLSINDFIKSLPLENGICDFEGRPMEDIKRYATDYCMGLPYARELGERAIDDIINQMSDSEFDRLMKDAVKKSEPLFRFDYHGHTPVEWPTNCFYIGVFNRDDSRLRKNDNFKYILEGNADVDFANIGQKDRIIIYRQRGVIPAYALAGLPVYRNKYEQYNNCDCHFDAELETRMKRERFSVEPSSKADDTLEYWVKGIIFGLVKNEAGQYWLKDESNDQLALSDYWEPLGEYRDDAYKAFRFRIVALADYFEKYLETFKSNVGNEAIKKRLEDVKAGQNYLNKYSQINMTLEEIKKKGHEVIEKLITDEINFVKKEL